MKHTKFTTGAAILLCTISLVGCGGSAGAQSPADTAPGHTASADAQTQAGQVTPDTASVEDENSEDNRSAANGDASALTEDASALLESADFSGNVVTVSDDGFVLSPQTNSEDGTVSMAAADGAATDSESISVVYQEDCIFQTAHIDVATGKASYTDATAADLQSQTSVAIYGSQQASGEILAEKVFITSYE